MKRQLLILAAVCMLCSGCNHYSEKDGTLVCGVPVKGSPWELAAQIAKSNDVYFIPQNVSVYEKKAYIKGYLNTNKWNTPHREVPYQDGFLPAEIWCELEDGQVIKAKLYRSTDDDL